MTTIELERAINTELDRINQSYINYQTSFLKDGTARYLITSASIQEQGA